MEGSATPGLWCYRLVTGGPWRDRLKRDTHSCGGVRLEARIRTRMGDGALVEMTPSQIRADLEEGTQAGAKRSKSPVLASAELDHLAEIFCSNSRFTGVDIGDEVVLSYDGCGSQDLGTRVNDLQYYEQYLCADSLELYHHDYSYKPAKAVMAFEQVIMRQAQFVTTAPLGYGAMPDLGLYTVPDGPVANWSELLPLGKIEEARAAQEEAVELAAADIVYVADQMVEAGSEFIDLDTAGAAGDADFLAALKAVERIRARHPDLGIQIGMAGEFVLGMHGELEYDGVRLAGLWPLDQMRLAAKAGVTIFGPAINVNTGKSIAWNVARTLTIAKPCCEAATVPVHLNGGMGVGGVPMHVVPAGDATCRASRAAVDILRLDGL
jgi:dimethylamine--corrinoid protein Co-methyltransferase